jgi:predicted metal-dependent TIM-barrel fold hydrolase
MKLEEFTKNLLDKADKDYGMCPPPISANEAMDVLIGHLLGEDWYVAMAMSPEQVYTEAVADILTKYPEKISLWKRIKNIFVIKEN